jgi:hypothetical protein
MAASSYPRWRLTVKSRLVATALVLLITACSKITEENFSRIDEGMSETEVIAILGTPTESNSVSILGLSGTTSRWMSRDAIVAVHFVNGKVALKTWEKPARS